MAVRVSSSESSLPAAVPVKSPGARRYPRSDKAVHLSPEERVARGRGARAEVPRASHAVFEPRDDRPDPVELLESQAATRVPELVPIRYGRMLVSAFSFYRGAALIMASDLSGTPRSGLQVQACGDAHLSNFGVFGSPERRLVFDINDFDETNPGPWEWDLKRLAASFEVAGRENGYTDKQRRSIALTVTRSYRETMARFATMPTMDVWYAHIDIETMLARLSSEVNRKILARAEKNVAKARTKDSMDAFAKLTTVVDGKRQIIDSPPLITRYTDLVAGQMSEQEGEEALRAIVRSYRKTLQTDRRHLLEQFDLVDVARKVVGVGSVGTRCWIVLMTGRDANDPLFLQVKEAPASVLEAYTAPSEYANHGQRVVAGQRLMQSASDLFLGWDRVKGIDGIQRDFYMRQLRDWKGSAVVEGQLPQGAAYYAQMCAWTLAKAHARSGDRIAIAAYLGKGAAMDNAVADFAAAYADQNQRDYEALQRAVAEGRVTAQTGL